MKKIIFSMIILSSCGINAWQQRLSRLWTPQTRQAAQIGLQRVGAPMVRTVTTKSSTAQETVTKPTLWQRFKAFMLNEKPTKISSASLKRQPIRTIRPRYSSRIPRMSEVSTAKVSVSDASWSEELAKLYPSSINSTLQGIAARTEAAQKLKGFGQALEKLNSTNPTVSGDLLQKIDQAQKELESEVAVSQETLFPSLDATVVEEIGKKEKKYNDDFNELPNATRRSSAIYHQIRLVEDQIKISDEYAVKYPDLKGAVLRAYTSKIMYGKWMEQLHKQLEQEEITKVLNLQEEIMKGGYLIDSLGFLKVFLQNSEQAVEGMKKRLQKIPNSYDAFYTIKAYENYHIPWLRDRIAMKESKISKVKSTDL